MAPQSCTKSSINHIMDVSGCSIPLRTLALFADLMKRQQERTDPFPFATDLCSCPKKRMAMLVDKDWCMYPNGTASCSHPLLVHWFHRAYG